MRLSVRRKPPYLTKLLEFKRRGTEVTIILFGAQRSIAGRIETVDAATGEVVLVYHGRRGDKPGLVTRHRTFNAQHIREIEWEP